MLDDCCVWPANGFASELWMSSLCAYMWRNHAPVFNGRKVEGRGLLERSHREVHLVQSDPSQRRLLLDFPKLLQRLPAGQLCSPCPETESNSAFSTAAFPPRPLCDANSSEGDLLSVSYPGFLQPFSSAIQTHRHSPTLANFSTSAVQRSRKCANSMAYQTAVEQDVPGQTDVGFHDSKDIRGRARGRARGGRVVKPGQGRSDKEFDRPVDTFDSLPQKRPRGRPRGTRGKAPVSRTASVPQDGCFGAGGGDVGESGGCPAPQNRYWEVVESGGPSSSNSFAPGLCPSPMLTSSLTSTLHTRGTSLNTVATYVPFVRSDKAALAPSDTVQQQTERRATHPQWGRDCAFDVGTAVGAAFHGDSTKKRRTSGEDDITEITRSSAFTGGFSTQTPNSQTFVHQASVGRQGQSQIEGCVTSGMLPMSNDGYTDSSFDSLVPSATVNYLESLDLGDDFWSELFHGLPSTGHLPPDTAPAHSQPLIPAADNDKPVLSCPAADLNLTAINADGLASLFVSAGSMSDLSSVLASVYPPAGHHQAPVDAALSGQPDTFLKPKPVMSIRRDQCILENILTGCGVKSKPGAIAGITSDQHPYTTVSHRSPVFSDFTLDDVSVLSAGCSANHIHAQRHKRECFHRLPPFQHIVCLGCCKCAVMMCYCPVLLLSLSKHPHGVNFVSNVCLFNLLSLDQRPVDTMSLISTKMTFFHLLALVSRACSALVNVGVKCSTLFTVHTLHGAHFTRGTICTEHTLHRARSTWSTEHALDTSVELVSRACSVF